VVWTPPPLPPCNFVDARTILVPVYCYKNSVSGIAAGSRFNIAMLFLQLENSHQGGGEDFRTLRHDDWITPRHITSGYRSQPKCPQRYASQNRRGGRLRSLEGHGIRGIQGYGRRRRGPSRPLWSKIWPKYFPIVHNYKSERKGVGQLSCLFNQ